MPDLPEFRRLADPGSTMLQLHMLGPPAILQGGNTLEVSRRQARALLFRLGARPEVLTRSQLCMLMWPDTAESKGRRRLTRLLTHLRQALPAGELVCTENENVWLDQAGIKSDTNEFIRLCADGAPGNTDNLRQAVALYRGHFLSGFSLSGAYEFERWAVTEQRTFEQSYLNVMELLIEDLANRGSYGEAIDLARQLLTIDELSETTHRRLIELYAADGNRSAALAQFERCAAILERELGVNPLPETQAVYDAILAGQTAAAAAVVEQPAISVKVAPRVPLVGRDKAWQVLENAYYMAERGQGKIVLFSGEAGIGKSRLKQVFANHIKGRSAILAGRCFASTQATPYLPIIEALQPHILGGGLLGVPDRWLAEASQLFPELGSGHSRQSELNPAPAEQTRSRLFEALRQLVLGLVSNGAPVLLCFDDLHWADQTTLDWLAYMARHLEGQHILIVGAYSSEEVSALTTFRNELSLSRMLIEEKLEGLDIADVLSLINHLMGLQPDGQDFAQRLKEITGGNPFFLLETLYLLAETGRHRNIFDSSVLPPLPDSVREAVLARVGQLSAKAQQILAGAAILGATFSFELLKKTTGRSELETVEGVEELMAKQLLVEENGLFRFRHELIQAAVFQNLRRWRRQLLHRRAAQTLEARLSNGEPLTGDGAGAELVARIGHQYAEAGDGIQAVKYLLQAGDRARTVYAHEEATNHYRRALRILEENGDLERAARTLMKLGLTYQSAFDFRRARKLYEAGFRQWRVAEQNGPSMALPPAPHALRLAWLGPSELDPTMVTGTFSSAVCNSLFSGLTEANPEMAIIPDIAQHWVIREGGRKFTFRLRRDVLWSDGRPVTAADFEYACQRILNPTGGSQLANQLYAIKGARAYHQGHSSDPDTIAARAVDEFTLEMEMENPTSTFPRLQPVPRHVVQKHGEAWTKAEYYVSSGPFLLDERRPGELLGLVRNPDYHGRIQGNLDRVQLTWIKDPGALVSMYQADELDVLQLDRLNTEQRSRAIRESSEDFISAPWARTTYILFNARHSPFDDRRVRQAFALATDKQSLAGIILGGYQSAATGGLVPHGVPGHSAGIGLPYDPEQAKRLLAEAGFPGGRGFPAVISLAPGSFFTTANEWLQEQWQAILGIEIRCETVSQTHWLERMQLDPPDLSLYGWVAEHQPDPGQFLQSGPVQVLGTWSNKNYDAILEKAWQATNQRERLKLFQAADRLLVGEAGLLPLLYGRLNLLVKPWVTRLPLSPSNYWFWKDVVIEPH